MPETRTREIRRPVAAGSFYSSNPVELTKQIAGYFASTEKKITAQKPVGLIVPHSAYQYAGKTMAAAFKLLEGYEYETVVIVAPAHVSFFQGISIYSGSAYETPLGAVEIDTDLSERLADINPGMVFASTLGHATGRTRGEHSLEVLLPFLQIVLGKFKLVAVMLGDQEPSTGRALGEALATVCQQHDVLLIASSDLSHYHSVKKAARLDEVVKSVIESFNVEHLIETIEAGKGEACGGGAMAGVILAAQRIGAGSAKVLDYATTQSSSTAVDDEVIGFLSAVILPSDKRARIEQAKSVIYVSTRVKEIKELDDKDKAMLRRMAIDALVTRLDGRNFKPNEVERLELHAGVFVRLTVGGIKREPFGRLRPEGPLYESVPSVTLQAAFEDPRYPELKANEFDTMELEIFVLSRLKRISEPSEIEIGRDGLLLKVDMHSSLMLPIEAAERNYTPTEFLEQISLKAGLPKNSWKDRYAQVYSFSVVTC